MTETVQPYFEDKYLDITTEIKKSMLRGRRLERERIINWIADYMKCNPTRFQDAGGEWHERACECLDCHPKDHGDLLTKLQEFIQERDNSDE